jgi:hypothetical protein
MIVAVRRQDVKLRLGLFMDARLDPRSTRQAGVALVHHRVGDPAGDPLYEARPRPWPPPL